MILKSSTDCAITVCFHGHYREALLTSILLGVDDLLSRHIAHLFIRDPLVVFSETIHQDDKNSNDHFEVFALTSASSCGD